MGTDDPTIDPTADPTKDPTTDPTTDPTQDPTVDPTIDPTVDPTVNPTFSPTSAPTLSPLDSSFVGNAFGVSNTSSSSSVWLTIIIIFVFVCLCGSFAVLFVYMKMRKQMVVIQRNLTDMVEQKEHYDKQADAKVADGAKATCQNWEDGVEPKEVLPKLPSIREDKVAEIDESDEGVCLDMTVPRAKSTKMTHVASDESVEMGIFGDLG